MSIGSFPLENSRIAPRRLGLSFSSHSDSVRRSGASPTVRLLDCTEASVSLALAGVAVPAKISPRAAKDDTGSRDGCCCWGVREIGLVDQGVIISVLSQNVAIFRGQGVKQLDRLDNVWTRCVCIVQSCNGGRSYRADRAGRAGPLLPLRCPDSDACLVEIGHNLTSQLPSRPPITARRRRAVVGRPLETSSYLLWNTQPCQLILRNSSSRPS